MRILKRFAELTAADRFLLLRAFAVVAAARLGLWTMPIVCTRGALIKIAAVGGGRSVKHLVWAVRAASRYFTHASCLTQALALEALLLAAGREARLQLGVSKDSGVFKAHAWVVSGDEIVIGGPDVARYSHLTDLETLCRPSTARWVA